MRRTAPARALAVVPLSAVVLLTGCGGGDDAREAGSSATATATTSTTAPTSSASASAAPTGSDPEGGGGAQASPFPTGTDPVTAEAGAGEGPTVVTALRVGDQQGFDRVVFEVSGSATPGWDVAYTDRPTQEGTGTAVEMPGTTFLRITLTGMTNPYEAPQVTEVARGVYPGQGGPVQAVYFDSTLEGQAVAYVGLAADRPFRVSALADPTRVVVDVQD